jgi:hypothetical protein
VPDPQVGAQPLALGKDSLAFSIHRKAQGYLLSFSCYPFGDAVVHSFYLLRGFKIFDQSLLE